MRESRANEFQLAFEQATVAIPANKVNSADEPGDEQRGPLLGLMLDMQTRLHSLAKQSATLPLLIFLQGSSYRQYEQRIADWLVDQFGLILVAPATHLLPQRLSYESPADDQTYRAVHQFRLDELAYVLEQLQQFEVIDQQRIIVMGHSEGAVAAGTWQGSVSGRILLAWSCENNYFSREHLLAGGDYDSWILNIIGSKDEYFARQNSLSSAQQVLGNGSEVLSDFKQAKVVIYPGEGHRILDNANARYDISAFLSRWQDETIGGADGRGDSLVSKIINLGDEKVIHRGY